MKISIEGNCDASKGGRNGFLSMLSFCLERYHGFKVVKSNEKSDVHLNSINGSIKKGARNFLRIDGIYYDKERLGKNKPIIKSALSHDHVIFQSQFSKENFEKITGSKVNSSIVFNGAKRLASISDSRDRLMIGCSAKWRVNKRLEGIVAAIDIARKKTSKDIRLKVIGEPDVNLPNFCVCTGKINNKLVQKELSTCQGFVHICHIESCPNSVVEALVVGLPVLCNNIGGTQEIVGSSGVISNIDTWNWKPIDSMDDTKLSPVQIGNLSNSILELISFDKKIKRDDLLIENAAAKYANIFKEK
jgi:glycosyltransferase involved in cell wall biosynthesis